MTTTLSMIEAIEIRAKEIYEGCNRDFVRAADEFMSYIVASDEAVKIALLDEFASDIASMMINSVKTDFARQQTNTIDVGGRSGEWRQVRVLHPNNSTPRIQQKPSSINRGSLGHLGGVMSRYLLDTYKTMDGSKVIGDCTPEELRAESVKGKTHGKFCELLAHGVPDGVAVRQCKNDDAAEQAMKLARQFAVE